MAADILIFNANKVPVGRDQVQHIEMARDIGQRFNHIYGGDYFVLPEAVIDENVATLPGLDGRKMSKSYNNTIPLFEGGEKALERAIMGMVTDSTRPNRIEQTKGSALYQLISAFHADGELMATIAGAAEDLGGWGAMKRRAIKSVNDAIGKYRDEYARLMANPQEVEDKLHLGAQRVRKIAQERITVLRDAVGLRDLRRREHKTEVVASKVEKPTLQLAIYRDDDKTFAFKIHDAKKNVLATQSGFADPKSAKDAAQSAMDALANA
jgi:tryptophanyl-tRNA synthetase